MEIEAKFAVPDQATFERLKSMQQLAGFTLLAGKVKRMHDTFLDTPDRRMGAAGYVCRRREVSGQVVMTIKGGSKIEGAIHQREELEVTLPADVPPQQWPDSPIRDRALLIIGAAPLAPLFDQHQTRIFRGMMRDEQMIAELTLDDVTIASGDKTLTYLEMEVELQPDGELADLEAIEASLQAEWGLMPEPRSKFARGLEWVEGVDEDLSN